MKQPPKTLAEINFKIRLSLHTALRNDCLSSERPCVSLQIQHAESYANLICVRLRMFITCKEIPRRALSVFSQERQRVAFQAEVCPGRGKKGKGIENGRVRRRRRKTIVKALTEFDACAREC